MSADPYSASEHGVDARERARLSWTFGYVAVILCLVSPCSSCMTLLGALPMALMAIQFARNALAVGGDEVAEVHARHGLATGVLALIYSVVVLGMVTLYVLLYVGLFAMALLSALISI